MDAVPERRSAPVRLIAGRFAVSRRSGQAAELHAEAGFPAAPEVHVLAPTSRVLVLGSTQSPDVVDPAALVAHGLTVVTRRSGGGAVVVGPGEVLWIDVFLPTGDLLWSDDVGRATHWLGSVWAEALRGTGVRDLAVHRGAMAAGPWGAAVCFAGIGPGEVTVAGRKVVGVAQRRTRAGARFQTAVLLRWDPEVLVAALGMPPSAFGVLAAAAAPVDTPVAALETAFLAALSTV